MPEEPKLDPVVSQFGDLFGSFFGGKASTRGADLRLDLSLSYVDARDGTQRDVEVTRRTPCVTCKGSAADAPPCPVCTGGVTEQRDTIHVIVPAGVKTGQVLRLQGKGGAHPTGPAGHLYLALVVDAENVLRRDGAHAIVEVPVPLLTSLFGGSLLVQTPDGATRVRIKRNAYDGEIITLREQGFARPGGDPYRGTARGDHKVVLRVSHAVRKQRDTIRWIAIIAIVMGLLIALQARG